MSDDSNETPRIEVNGSPLPDQAWSGVRALLLAGTSFALGRHWIEGDLATLIGVAVGVVLPIVSSQMKNRHRATQLANIANDKRVPDEVAVIK